MDHFKQFSFLKSLILYILLNKTLLSMMYVNLFMLQTVAAPKGNEWSKFAKTLQEMKQQATEREEEAMSLSTMTSPLR